MKKLIAVEVTADPDVWLAVKLDERDVSELAKRGTKMVELREEGEPIKKGFAFIAPVLPLLPTGATIIGAATLGIIGGAASYVGGRVGEWMVPRDRPKKGGDGR